jgi:hypothetical protein
MVNGGGESKSGGAGVPPGTQCGLHPLYCRPETIQLRPFNPQSLKARETERTREVNFHNQSHPRQLTHIKHLAVFFRFGRWVAKQAFGTTCKNFVRSLEKILV